MIKEEKMECNVNCKKTLKKSKYCKDCKSNCFILGPAGEIGATGPTGVY